VTSLSNVDSVVVSLMCFNHLKFVPYKKFTYHPWAHNKFNKIFKHHNVVLTPQNKYSNKNLLNFNLKDNIPPQKKSGIYRINCKDCKKIYIGKTQRDLETKVKEYFRNIKISSSSTCIERKTCNGS
jgi:GIY-YIG catalytic domain.